MSSNDSKYSRQSSSGSVELGVSGVVAVVEPGNEGESGVIVKDLVTDKGIGVFFRVQMSMTMYAIHILASPWQGGHKCSLQQLIQP